MPVRLIIRNCLYLLVAESSSAICSSNSEYLSAVSSRHSLHEAVNFLSLKLFRLICSFHRILLLPLSTLRHFIQKKRPRRCLNLQGHSKLQYRYEKSPCNVILQLIHTPFVKPVHNIFIFFLILFFFALRGLLSEKPAAYVLLFYVHSIYCVPNINFICIKCFFLSLKNILFILISFLIYNIQDLKF